MSWSSETTVRARGGPRGAVERVPTLRVLETPELPPSSPHLIALTPGRSVVIGRGDGATLQLKDPGVSRVHARVTRSPDGVVLEDVSANGTFVDGTRVEETVLEDGAVVRVGDSFLVLRHVAPSQPDASIPALVGDAPAMQELRHTISLVGPSNTSVLVLGESGTGKELAARALHDRSGRRGPLVTVNCAAIPSELAESQLFGHAAGAFTGAQRAHEGFFRAADGGTLLLDEIGDLPPAIQAKLLRVLEDRAVTPLGSTAPVPVDVRVVAATHRDLAAGIDEGWFRGDLLARLSEIVLTLPPLRARREDVLPILRHALGDARPLAPDLVHALLCAPLRFNVRELIKIARELAVRAAGAPRYELALVAHRLEAAPSSSAPAPGAAPSKDELIALLRQHGGNVSLVAKAARRSRKQIYRYLRAHDIDAAVFRKGA